MNVLAHRAGSIAIIGRPNVGKSTLLNRMVGMKISITSNRPQTTRHRLNGFVTETDAQMVLVDTPGFQTTHGGALNRLMNRTVTDSLHAVDVVLLVVDTTKFTREDRRLLALLPDRVPVILVINKVDKLVDKAVLLPFLEEMSKVFSFAEIVPVSAAKGTHIAHLKKLLKAYLPEGPAQHDEDEVTDRPERFLAAELVREKLFRMLGEELPYAATVLVDKFEVHENVRHIHMAIIVDKPNHKAMEKLFGGKVFLELWVRIKSGWAETSKSLKNLGYE
jgi:GTPase